MFQGSRKQLAVLRHQSLRTKDERQKDTQHLFEVRLEVPLDSDLADEILAAMKADLFDEAGEPRPNMTAVEYVIPNLGAQKLTVLDHPDLTDNPVGVFRSVVLRHISAQKTDDGKSWALSFVAGWVFMESPTELALMKRIKRGSVYLMMEPEQASLELAGQTEQTAAPAAEGGAKRGRRCGGGGGGRGGRRKKHDPEAERQQQVEDGSARGADGENHELRPGVVEQFADDGQEVPTPAPVVDTGSTSTH